MIPDFLFERFGRKVYFEIVGFWTKEYLERKAAKLKVLLADNQKDQRRSDKTIDLLIAINSDLSCSQIETISHDRIFTFKKNVPIKPILEHLKKIDDDITAEKTSDTKIDVDPNSLDLISVKQVAQKYEIPDAAVLKIVDADYPGMFATINSYLISKKKMNLVRDTLDGVSRFVQACNIMKSDGIPDSCHADLLSELGYDVSWPDLDSSNATISRK